MNEFKNTGVFDHEGRLSHGRFGFVLQSSSEPATQSHPQASQIASADQLSYFQCFPGFPFRNFGQPSHRPHYHLCHPERTGPRPILTYTQPNQLNSAHHNTCMLDPGNPYLQSHLGNASRLTIPPVQLIAPGPERAPWDSSSFIEDSEETDSEETEQDSDTQEEPEALGLHHNEFPQQQCFGVNTGERSGQAKQDYHGGNPQCFHESRQKRPPPNYTHRWSQPTPPDNVFRHAIPAHFWDRQTQVHSSEFDLCLNAGGISSIRNKEKMEIRSHLLPGSVVQVCGAPMTGKSTLVRQAVCEAELLNSPQPTQQHHINCKGMTSFQQLLNEVAAKFHQLPPGSHLDIITVLNFLKSCLSQQPRCHHLFIFHKCESLRDTAQSDFLHFLCRTAQLDVSVSVIFTTYKYFWQFPKQPVRLVKINTLSVNDIIILLQNYFQDLDVVSYSIAIAKTFCYPEAVCLIAEIFLADPNLRVPPELLEKRINKDYWFLSRLFESRREEVNTWIPERLLMYMTHFMHSIDNSFTEAFVEYVNSLDSEQECYGTTDPRIIIRMLKKDNVLRQLDRVSRLVVHPLVVYYWMESQGRKRQLIPQKWFDSTFNRFTHFLGRVLLNFEANMQEHGRKGLIFSGLVEEWHNVRYLLQTAITCNIDSYQNFLKMAVSTSGFILRCFQREAESFYESLYNSAIVRGDPRELGVMEAMLGKAVTDGTGKDLVKADGYLTSAIQRLSQYGNSYFLGLAYLWRGILLHRQGKYEESLRCFNRVKHILTHVDLWALGETFYVSEVKVEEAIISQAIHSTIPIIFTGHNKMARQMLDTLLEQIQSRFENHPDLGALLNLIGLAIQRGSRDLESALRWYKLAYNERTYWAKMCPENLLAVLNNIGMIFLYQQRQDGSFVCVNLEECLKYLQKALDIRRECGWTHYNTALTLFHLSEINLKMLNFEDAFKNLLEADRILAVTVKDHDLRLQVCLLLAHLRILLRQASDPSRSKSSYAPHEQRTSNGSSFDDSFTSSKMFAPGVSDQEEHHFYGSLDNPQRYVSHHNQLRHNFPDCLASRRTRNTSSTRIEPCDLQFSAEYYLEKLLLVSDSMKGTHSDDGLSSKMCAHEHIMLLNLVNSQEKYDQHKNHMIEFTSKHPWTQEMGALSGAGVESRYRCLIKHQALYNYILKTPYDGLDFITFIELMQTACLICGFDNEIFNMEMWKAEVWHCIKERDARQPSRRNSERQITANLLNDSNLNISSTFINELELPGGVFAAGCLDECPLPVSGKDNPENNTAPTNINSLVNNSPLKKSQPLPKFDELFSNSSLENSPSQLESLDIFKNAKDLTFPNCMKYDQTHQRNEVSHIFVPERVANDQKQILSKIQSGRMSTSSTGDISTIQKVAEEPERGISETEVWSSIYQQAGREPVEQSYTEESCDSLVIDNVSLTKIQNHLLTFSQECAGYDLQEIPSGINLGSPESCLRIHPEYENDSLQTTASAHCLENLLPAHSSINFELRLVRAPPDSLIQPRWGVPPFHSNPVYQLSPTEEKDSAPFATPAKASFSVCDYLKREGFGDNLNVPILPEQDKCQSSEETIFNRSQHDQNPSIELSTPTSEGQIEKKTKSAGSVDVSSMTKSAGSVNASSLTESAGSVNVMSNLTSSTSQQLDTNYDAEILETASTHQLIPTSSFPQPVSSAPNNLSETNSMQLTILNTFSIDCKCNTHSPCDMNNKQRRSVLLNSEQPGNTDSAIDTSSIYSPRLRQSCETDDSTAGSTSMLIKSCRRSRASSDRTSSSSNISGRQTPLLPDSGYSSQHSGCMTRTLKKSGHAQCKHADPICSSAQQSDVGLSDVHFHSHPGESVSGKVHTQLTKAMAHVISQPPGVKPADQSYEPLQLAEITPHDQQ